MNFHREIGDRESQRSLEKSCCERNRNPDAYGPHRPFAREKHSAECAGLRGRRQNKPRLPVRNYTPDAYGPNSDIRPYR